MNYQEGEVIEETPNVLDKARAIGNYTIEDIYRRMFTNKLPEINVTEATFYTITKV